MSKNTLHYLEPLSISSELQLSDTARFLLEHELEGVNVIDNNGKFIGTIVKDAILDAIAHNIPHNTKINKLLLPNSDNLKPHGNLQNELGKHSLNTTIKDWEACFNAIYNPVIAVDNKGTITFFNHAVAKATGVPASEAYGQNIKSLFDTSTLSDVLESGQIEPTQKFRLDEKTYISNRSPIIKDDKIVGAVAVLQEISDFESIVEELAYTRSLNRKLDAIFESSFDGLYITDGEGYTLSLNKGFERITGVSSEECVGRNMRELVAKKVFSDSGTLKALVNGESTTITLVVRTGKEVLVTSNPIFDDNGNIVLVVTNVRDITELNDLQRKLEQVEGLRQRELDAIFESSFDGLYITDGEANTIRLNKGFERITGITADECVGRNMKDLVAEGVFSASGTLFALEKRERASITLVARTGKEVLVTSNPIFDDNGNIILVVTNVRDFTELNDLQRKLEHVEGLRQLELDAIFESSFDGLYITDGEANTISLNKGFERITGVTAEECIGRNMADLVKEGIYSRSGTLLALETRETATIPLQAKTGKNALVTSTPIFDDEGNIILVVTNVRDITELNALQDKLEQIEGLSRFYQTELQQLKLYNQCIIHSSKMRELVDLVMRIAHTDSTVLIQGESGVGKELVANTLHANSNRSNGPFVKINCGAIPENLLESELFGYDPGAFSGASKKGKAGLFELADGGILFLDEIGDLPLNLQVKLLRVLQDMTISRLGGTTTIKIDVRILAGTNRNLPEMIDKRLFRKDLYYRLNVVPVSVPPLRERREDIPVLSKHFLENFNTKHNMKKKLSAEVLGYFMTYNWPGNVRELENLIERLVVTSINDTIGINDLFSWAEISATLPETDEQELLPLQLALENTERHLLQKAFSRFKSTYAVARALEVSQPTIVRKAAKYGIKRE